MKLITEKHSNKITSLLMAVMFSFGAPQVSVAEDIEIYNGANTGPNALTGSAAKPNILFVLDSSGSMRSNYAAARNPLSIYNSQTDYATGNASDNRLYIYDDNENYTGMSVSINNAGKGCISAINHFNNNPFSPKFFDRAAVFYRAPGAGGSWVDIIPTGANLNTIAALECESDNGTHGLNNAATDLFPMQTSSLGNTTTPNYTNLAQEGLVWNNFPERYLVSGNYHDYLQNLPVAQAAVRNAPNTATINTPPSTYCRSNFFRNNFIVYAVDGDLYQCQSRNTILRNAVSEVVATMTNTNAGIMRFSGSGAIVTQGVVDADVPANRAALIAAAQAVPARGGTPLSGALYDAYSYYAGVNAVQRGSAANVLNGNQYISPIQNDCQDNIAILFSDGQPSSTDVARDGQIRAMSGQACNVNNTVGGGCLDEAAFGMANTDVNANIAGTNNVYTYTIGFAPSGNTAGLLLNTANAGNRPGAALNSQYYAATDSTQLQAAFQSILNDVPNVDADSFVAPAVSVSSYNRLQSRDDLYFSVFKPSDTPRWLGNLKKYKLVLNSNDIPEIRDVNDNNAINPADSSFVPGAQSYWSDAIDGDIIQNGGFANELVVSNTNPRKLYASLNTNDTAVELLTSFNFLTQTYRTDVDGQNGVVDDGIANSDDIPLGDINNPDLITNRNLIVDWSMGFEQAPNGVTQPNYYLGESLHSTPYVISFGTTESNPGDVVFTTTNQGMLHAVDGDNGSELWAYIPDSSLFSNLGDYYNDVAGANHSYGLDGEIAFDVVRNPVDNTVQKANLFLSQRRGGSKYFAVSVQGADNGTAPRKLWTIEGGTGDFVSMGQSWAKPVKAKINYCTNNNENSCAIKDVLVISGGYDTAYDDETLNLSSINAGSGIGGNAIYIIDNDTDVNGNPSLSGATDKREPKILWMAGRNVVNTSRDFQSNDMIHSFPSQPTVVDSDFDGVADLMFAVDVSGKVWRFDFKGHVEVDSNGQVTIDSNDIRADNNNATGTEDVSGGIIADLSGDNRRFYNSLDVSLTPNTDAGVSRYNIVTGSGYRAHPRFDEGLANGGENNKLFVVFDRNLQHPQFTFNGNNPAPTGITYDYQNLNKITVDGNGFSELTGAINASPTGAHRNGFYVNLQKNSKEKMINTTLTNNYQVLAVSYSPDDAPVAGPIVNNSPCRANVGSSRLYQINLLSGVIATDDLDKPGLSPKPVIIRLPDSNGIIKESLLIGTEVFGTTQTGSADGLSNGGNNVEIESVPEAPVRRLNWWEFWDQ